MFKYWYRHSIYGIGCKGWLNQNLVMQKHKLTRGCTNYEYVQKLTKNGQQNSQNTECVQVNIHCGAQIYMLIYIEEHEPLKGWL